ncbi:hypothetical protein M8C21_027419 [Ambrosia artemisiifolia]|uniref:Uncharacterized protein n=1 Tax=Ambrosia artemisiifolia TaxID=4212 RepID=A0AAD5G773_AMBAR|nr:hypothetical protein M8C21_027419 [Ambrosia artemisiifolia]
MNRRMGMHHLFWLKKEQQEKILLINSGYTEEDGTLKSDIIGLQWRSRVHRSSRWVQFGS